MVSSPYTQSAQNTNKCPHGLPQGTCPICNGSMAGGIRKDRDKPRVAGEMSYNECLAEWHKIQARKEAKLQERIDRLEASRDKILEKKIQEISNNIQKNIDKFLDKLPPIIQTPAKFIANKIIMPIINFVLKIPLAIKNIQTFFTNVQNFISSVSEKMAMVLGEVKNFIDANLYQKIKKAAKTLLSLFSETTEEEQETEEMKRLKAREFKKILKSIFRLKNKEEKQEQNESNERF